MLNHVWDKNVDEDGDWGDQTAEAVTEVLVVADMPGPITNQEQWLLLMRKTAERAFGRTSNNRRLMRTIGTITNEGYSCTITEDDDGRVHFLADADIDADGANGQNGGPAAYKVDDSGTELLANGGMKIVQGKVVCAQPWARDIVILDVDNEPKVFEGGTTLETPPAQPNGGANNSTLAAGTVTLATPLAPGASINIQFLWGVQATGSFKAFVNVEGLP